MKDLTGMEYYLQFADSIGYVDEEGKPIENVEEFIDEELEKEEELK